MLPGKLETFDDGYKTVDVLVRKWNAQPNPPKVYVSGNRVHHGLVGVGLAAVGLLFDNKPALGAGVRLMVDDIADSPDWFNFTK
jgi:hypothetical protein